jgi:hypothetical protein
MLFKEIVSAADTCKYDYLYMSTYVSTSTETLVPFERWPPSLACPFPLTSWIELSRSTVIRSWGAVPRSWGAAEGSSRSALVIFSIQ